MKELEKNLEATGGVPAEAELAAINRFAKSPLRAEEVYTFSLRLCDNEVDRDWERFDTAALNTLGDLFVGKSGIFDHQWTAEGQTARIYRTEMVREGAQVTAAGDGTAEGPGGAGAEIPAGAAAGGDAACHAGGRQHGRRRPGQGGGASGGAGAAGAEAGLRGPGSPPVSACAAAAEPGSGKNRGRDGISDLREDEA